MADRLKDQAASQQPDDEPTEEQLIADAYANVKVLVEAGDQAGYLQIQPTEVHRFMLASYDDVLVEKYTEAKPQELSKWETATALAPLLNRIEPQDEQQLGKIQLDPVTGKRYMLVPIEVNVLVDGEKFCNIFEYLQARQKKHEKALQVKKEALVDMAIEATAQKTVRQLVDQENTPKEETQKKAQKSPKKASQRMSLKERPTRRSQKKQLQGEQTPQEEPQGQTSKESQRLVDYKAEVVVPPIIFSVKAGLGQEAQQHATEPAASSNQQEEEKQV
ncbi:uncharacterized protein LOC121403871 isoform X1 [Drosophila obscura]|uniref:uncharacterized protein LOC121403871 isoform X1 n=1 Tax=Drosophila obscura TaxID=7282 RepID=UPI001BB1AAFD|nr:uncharacterized protein LOC121403871 isoform X1 [Drosophila obscura]